MTEFNYKQELCTQAFINGIMPLSEYHKHIKLLNKEIRSLKKKDKHVQENNFLSITKLYKKYSQKKLSEKEYLYLLENTLNKITVYQEKVVFDTKFGIFEQKRKIVKRQKGITIYSKPIEK